MYVPAARPFYLPVKSVLSMAATAGLLMAIAALGLDTSPSAIASLGWRHVATMTGTTFVILAIVTAGLLMLG